VQGTEGHNTAQIGGFVMLPPVIMAAVAAAARASSSNGIDSTAAAAAAQAVEHLRTTHDSNKLAAVAERYAQVMARSVLVSFLNLDQPYPQSPWLQHCPCAA
jgi:hypothetical protein